MSCKINERQTKRAAWLLSKQEGTPDQLFNLRQHIERYWDQCPVCQGRWRLKTCQRCQGVGAVVRTTIAKD